MSRLFSVELPLSGLHKITRQPIFDERGSFSRLFCMDELAAIGWPGPIAQINLSHTRHPGTIRGMHFQSPPNADAKLVSCISGEVWDVAIDLRNGSPSFLHCWGERLSADNGYAMLIPPGFAHGFQALSKNVELLYFHSKPYVPESEGGIHPLDPRIAPQWPLPPKEMSGKDSSRSYIAANFHGISI